MQSRGLLPNRRQEMQVNDGNPGRSNGILSHGQISYYPQQVQTVKKNHSLLYQDQNLNCTTNLFLSDLNQVERNHRRQRIQRGIHQKMLNPVSILRNGGQTQRPYYATLPKRNRTINFADQIRPQDIRRISKYPKSLQDLTALELEAILDRDPQPTSSSSFLEEDCSLEEYFRRHLENQGDIVSNYYIKEEKDEEDYLNKLYRSLPRHRQLPKDRLIPGKVHYEKECRMYGNAIAEIYYKTCYL